MTVKEIVIEEFRTFVNGILYVTGFKEYEEGREI